MFQKDLGPLTDFDQTEFFWPSELKFLPERQNFGVKELTTNPVAVLRPERFLNLGAEIFVSDRIFYSRRKPGLSLPKLSRVKRFQNRRLSQKIPKRRTIEEILCKSERLLQRHFCADVHHGQNQTKSRIEKLKSVKCKMLSKLKLQGPRKRSQKQGKFNDDDSSDRPKKC